MLPIRSFPRASRLACASVGLLSLLGACQRTAPSRPPGDGTGGAPAAHDDATPPTVLTMDLLRLGSRYACARRDRDLVCWGQRVMVPDGDIAHPDEMMTMPVQDPLALALGSDRMCVIAEGKLLCWGHDVDVVTPRLDDTSDFRAIEEVESIVDPIDVQLYDSQVCALERSGMLTCWTYEENDDDEAEEDVDPWMEEHAVGSDVQSFAAGDEFVCGILADGTIECWGSDYQHEAIIDAAWDACMDVEVEDCEDEEGNFLEDCEPIDPEEECDEEYDAAIAAAWIDPLPVEGITEPRTLVAGSDFACALTKGGRVFCWGEGSDGQIGHGARDDSRSPVAVLDLHGVTALAAGDAHACAVHRDGRVSCWGNNRHGAVGGQGATVAVPRFVAGIADAVDVELTDDLSCAIVRGGPPRCWGRDPGMRVRGATQAPPIVPVAVQDVSRVLAFAHTTCAATRKGMQCWGQGTASKDEGVMAAAQPHRSRHRGLVEIAEDGPCALTTSHEVRCWRSLDELHEHGPAALLVADAIAFDGGSKHSCAVREDGTVHCWRGEMRHGAPPTTQVAGLGPASDVAVGRNHACAVLRTGAVDCWEGPDTATPRLIRLPALDDAVEVVERHEELCVRTRGGLARCWEWGELDRPSFDHPLRDVTALTSGHDHMCAVAGGEVWCWGRNGNGQLGPELDDTRSAAPVRVPPLHEVVEVVAGSEHTCARGLDGSVRCWGRDDAGQLGRLPRDRFFEPTPIVPPQWLTRPAAPPP